MALEENIIESNESILPVSESTGNMGSGILEGKDVQLGVITAEVPVATVGKKTEQGGVVGVVTAEVPVAMVAKVTPEETSQNNMMSTESYHEEDIKSLGIKVVTDSSNVMVNVPYSEDIDNISVKVYDVSNDNKYMNKEGMTCNHNIQDRLLSMLGKKKGNMEGMNTNMESFNKYKEGNTEMNSEKPKNKLSVPSLSFRR